MATTLDSADPLDPPDASPGPLKHAGQPPNPRPDTYPDAASATPTPGQDTPTHASKYTLKPATPKRPDEPKAEAPEAKPKYTLKPKAEDKPKESKPAPKGRPTEASVEKDEDTWLSDFRTKNRREPTAKEQINSPPALERRELGLDIAGGFAGVPMAVMGKEVGAWLRTLAHREPLENVIAAREVGYVLPPVMASENPSQLSQALSGWGGKIKTEQAASLANQDVTNKLAAKSLGLSENTTLTDEVFRSVRDKAGKAYQAVKDAYKTMTADGTFKKDIEDLAGPNAQAAELFPEIMNNPQIKEMQQSLMKADRVPTEAVLEIVKKLRFDGNANLKAIGDPGKHALGLAQRHAADAIDRQIERNLADLGQPELVEKYREARKLIARSYDVEGATNSATGDVSGRGLARLANKGRPLSGELDTIAQTATAFPRAMRDPTSVGGAENWSVLDFYGLGASAVAGHPLIGGVPLLRPLARKAALSPAYQDAMVKPGPRISTKPTGPTPLTNAAAAIGAQVGNGMDRNDAP